MKVGYIILAHQDPGNVARVARLLAEDGGLVAIHYDANAGPAAFAQLQQALGDLQSHVLWPRRIRVAWGEWSIVAATLNGLEAIERSGERVDYVHLMSGTDYPIRPLAAFRDYLERVGGDFIECADMARERWVKDGLTHERYRYRHLLNWRRTPRAFDASWHMQRRLGLVRQFPPDLLPHLGSQWWTLTWETCRIVLAAGRRADYRRFFGTVWIPDEMFIQSVVGTSVASERRHRHCLTLFQFTDRGLPVVFANDHADYLTRQSFFFARKLSRHASRLRDTLDDVARGSRPVSPLAIDAVGAKSDEYEQARLAGARPVPGRRVMGRDADPWRGELLWNAQPFVAVLGASVDELKLIQQILAATGTMVCHGALFDPGRIHFAGQPRQFAGYGRPDVKLRDHRRTSFLSDVIMASAPRTSGLLLPKEFDEDIRDVVLWSRHACVLVVRGNAFRAFIEHRERAADAALIAARSGQAAPASLATGSDLDWVAPQEFDDVYKACRAYYRHIDDTVAKSGIVCQDINLLQPGWLRNLQYFLDCAVPPDRQARHAVPLSPLTADWIERLALQLPDPAQSIANIDGLTELRLAADERALHREIASQGRRVAPPVLEGVVPVPREQAGLG